MENLPLVLGESKRDTVLLIVFDLKEKKVVEVDASQESQPQCRPLTAALLQRSYSPSYGSFILLRPGIHLLMSS